MAKGVAVLHPYLRVLGLTFSNELMSFSFRNFPVGVCFEVDSNDQQNSRLMDKMKFKIIEGAVLDN